MAELVPETASDTHECLSTLVRRELIRPDRPVFSGERAYSFRHLLIRDAAYDSIPKEARAALHEQHAGWLEQKAGDRTLEFEEILGYHLEQAFRYRSELGPVDETDRELARRAAERLGAAGRRAFVRSDAPAAVNLISRAAAMLSPDDPARVDLVPNVRVAQGIGGDLTWADEILSAAFEAGDARVKAHALVQRGFLRLFTDARVTPDELAQVADESMSVFRGLGDELGMARAWRLVAQTHYLARRGGACAEASEQALVHARRAGDTFEAKEIVEWLAVALTHGPAPASKASRRCEHLLEDAAGDPFLEVTLLSVRAFLEAMQGRSGEAERLLVQAGDAVSRDAGALRRVAYFSLHAGLVHLISEHPEAAELELRSACHVLEEVGERTNYSFASAVLSQVLCALGRHEEARSLTEASERAARANDVMANVIWRSARGKALAHLGDFAAAETLAREAVTYAAEGDFLQTHGDALLDFALVLNVAGRPREGLPAIEEAIQLFEQKGNVVSAVRARTKLEHLMKTV